MKTVSLLTTNTTAEIAFTAGARREVVESIIVVNTSSSAVTYQVWIDPEGKEKSDKNLLQPQKSLAAYTKEEIIPDSTIIIDPSGSITVQDATGGAIAIHITSR